MANVAHYANVVVKIERFMRKQAANYDKSTQTYEAFIQCLIEFMRFYKSSLNQIATVLEKKGWLVYVLNTFLTQSSTKHQE